MGFEHKSVLLEETINGLNIRPDGTYVDGTLGGGGHAYEIARRLSDKGSIIGIDQDAAAIEAAGIRLKDFGEKVTIVRSNYCEMKSRLHELGIDKVDGMDCLIDDDTAALFVPRPLPIALRIVTVGARPSERGAYRNNFTEFAAHNGFLD